MITARILLSIIALVCWPVLTPAQITSADDYFNRAGKQYVKEDKHAALRTLDQALRQYPGDPRLLKFAEELIREEQQKQQQQQQQQRQQKQQQEQQKQEQQGKEEQEKQKQQQEERSQEQQERKPEPGRIAPPDAKRILDALERKEKDVQQKVRERQRPSRRVPIEKDW